MEPPDINAENVNSAKIVTLSEKVTKQYYIINRKLGERATSPQLYSLFKRSM